jgi:hypothetical protein
MFFAAATPATVVGDVVTNPLTGANETVISLITAPSTGEVIYVVTSTGNVILTKFTVGNLIPSTDAAVTTVYQIVSVTVNATSGIVDKVNVNLTTDIGANPAVTPTLLNVLEDQSALYNAPPPPGTVGTPGTPQVIAPQAAAGAIYEVSKGADGSSGSDAYGVSVCAPSWLGGGCVTIAKLGSKGVDGTTGPTINRTVLPSHGAISTTAINEAAIELGSVGGNGGTGTYPIN